MGCQCVGYKSRTQSLRVTKCSLLTALISNLLRKLVHCADSDSAPEVACCHQRTLRNSKTLLYRLVRNTLPALLHIANMKVIALRAYRINKPMKYPAKCLNSCKFCHSRYFLGHSRRNGNYYTPDLKNMGYLYDIFT